MNKVLLVWNIVLTLVLVAFMAMALSYGFYVQDKLASYGEAIEEIPQEVERAVDTYVESFLAESFEEIIDFFGQFQQ